MSYHKDFGFEMKSLWGGVWGVGQKSDMVSHWLLFEI